MKQILLFAFFSISISSFAQWSKDTTVRNPICTAANLQYEPLMCSDSHKGAIIVWADQRPPAPGEQQIFVQRIDSNGVTKWTQDGIVLPQPTGTFAPDAPLIESDGAGGAIIFYTVTFIGGADGIYAQRIDGNGNLLWGSTGVPVATAQDSRIRSNQADANNNAAADGEGGAFITYQTYGPFNIMAQHIDKNGTLLWGTNGVQVTNADSTTAGYESWIINTGLGTAVAGYSYGYRLYLQRISAAGALQWGAGTLVSNTFSSSGSGNQGAYLVYDSLSATKNVMLTWIDVRYEDNQGHNINLYAQKVDINGNIVWQKNGIPLTASAFGATNPDMVIDKAGGFFIAYDSIYTTTVQHVNSSGNLLWGHGGIATAPGYVQTNPVIADDGSGGIITMWYDERTGPHYSGSALFAQRYTLQGNALWRADGIPVITQNVSINHTNNPILSLEDGTAIACWSNGDVYAAKFGGTDGLLPVNLTDFVATLQKNTTLLQWKTAQEINSSYFEVEHADNSLQFSRLATIQATGNANVPHGYSTVDPSPVTGINYYRLKEVDKDGSFVYSNIVSVTVNGVTGMAAYPNPAKANVTIKINALTQKTVLNLYDIQGRLVMQKQVTLANGDNLVEWDVSNIAPGIYYVEAGKTGMRAKIVKQ
jgi:hypothetical protein